MKSQRNAFGVLGFFSILFFLLKSAWALDVTPTKFVYPTGTKSIAGTGWLASGCNGKTAYQQDRYHIGYDIPANIDDPVYAISDGDYVQKSENGWEPGNVALIYKHTLDNGTKFLALYGHVRLLEGHSTPPNKIFAGQPFARVGFVSTGNHLHFGIHPGLSLPASNFGLMPCASWPVNGTPDTNGFVSPITWIVTKAPDHPTIPCYLLSLGSPVQSGFGVPWNVLSPSDEPFIQAFCNASSSSATINVGTGAPNQYIFNSGYELKNNQWTQFTYQCRGIVVSNTWCVGQATATLTPNNITQQNGFLTHICTFVNNQWKCGCRDQTCATAMWQLQNFQK